jgi:hypothetical protein
MNRTHSLVLAALVIAASFGAVAAQGGRQRLPAPRDPQFYEPRNKLEEFESRLGTILIKGRTYVGTLRVQAGSARVEATEIRDTGNSTRATGVVITFTTVESGGPPGEVRSLIDYEDIDPLIKAFDTAAKADESITKLTHFEARYRTRGDLDIVVFKKISGGVAAVVEGGFLERKRLTLTLDEFTKLRWFIAQAKDRLDEIPLP